MDMILWIFQWVASIVGVGSFCVLLVYCFQEFGYWGLAFLLFPPALLAYYAPTRWTKCKVPMIVFLTCFAIAMILQRLRLGYWAWPDVERGA